MTYMNCQVKRVGFRGALLWGILGLILLLPATVWASSHTVKVPPPNGVDDTANIQSALNKCVAFGKGCTVQLQAGTYLTQQVVVYNFQGTFKGMGMDNTTIEALPNLPVNLPANCQPNLTTCLWPSLFIFVDGNITVSDLTLNANAVPATKPWGSEGTTYTMLFEVLGFMGQYPTHVTISRIRMEGQPSTLSTDWGYNVMNGAHYSGELARSPAPGDNYFLSGSYTVQSSFFDNVYVPISQDQFVTSSQITIGGSPSAGNHIENACGGLDIETSQKSTFEISYNESSAGANCAGASMWVENTWPATVVPSGPSRYFIHNNKFTGTGQYTDGIFLYDDATSPYIQAAIWNNTIELQDTLSEGIGVVYTKGTAIWNNSVTGTDGFDAIGLYSSTFDAVVNNNVSGFTVDSTVGNAQIYLDPSTTNDFVVCAERSDTVLNQGTNNIILGCQQTTASAEAATRNVPTTSATRPNLPRKKPQLPH